VLLAALVLLLGGAVSGCSRVLTALAVQPDDTVSGEVVIATPPRSPTDSGPLLTVPPDLKDRIETTPYKVDEYVGYRLLFDGLTFNQLSELTKISSQAQGRYELNLRRVGDRVLVSGRADLASIAVDKADFQLKVSFPGRVVETNGTEDSGTISWTFTPGQVNEISATVTYDDPKAPSVALWALILGTIVAGTAVGMVLLARRDRNPPAGLLPGAR
jgi:hypothetical protein